MARSYAKNGKSLPLKFWNIDIYKKDYKLTLIRANALLKVYDDSVLVRMLIENKWLYSLWYPKLQELVDQVEAKDNAVKAKLTEAKDEVKLEDTTEFRQVVSRKESLRSKLD